MNRKPRPIFPEARLPVELGIDLAKVKTLTKEELFREYLLLIEICRNDRVQIAEIGSLLDKAKFSLKLAKKQIDHIKKTAATAAGV